jgi:hypothetical protein
MEGKATLVNMAETPIELRNGEHYPKEYLEKLQKLIVRNSLNIAKVQMMTMGGKPLPEKLRLVVDQANSMTVMPALELK